MPSSIPRLIVASGASDPDMLFATGFFTPDPFVYVEKNGRSMVMLSDLEVDRGRANATVDKVIAQTEVAKRAGKDVPFDLIVAQFLKEHRIRKVRVPASFPLGLATKLEKAGIQFVPVPGLFFEQREFKTDRELKLMRRALSITEAGMARAMEVLAASKIKPGRRLAWAGRTLTSELLRAEIESAILHAGGQPANTIVAGGAQACDPHELGHGPLKANSLIILDIFPRDARSGYFGDMTRTVIRGRPSDAQRHLWETVLEGQKRALRLMKPGVDGAVVHNAIKDYFTESGYQTKQKRGRWTGFFHGPGHGLGLEIHEDTRLQQIVLKPGHVLTVEPGLYYPGIGGARIEDVAAITRSGIRMLSRFEKRLVI